MDSETVLPEPFFSNIEVMSCKDVGLSLFILLSVDGTGDKAGNFNDEGTISGEVLFIKTCFVKFETTGVF